MLQYSVAERIADSNRRCELYGEEQMTVHVLERTGSQWALLESDRHERMV